MGRKIQIVGIVHKNSVSGSRAGQPAHATFTFSPTLDCLSPPLCQRGQLRFGHHHHNGG
jgi:hypothetical protein